MRLGLSSYLRLLIFLLAILIPACASSSQAFCMMYSACKLNKQGDTIQSWCTPLPIWNQFPKWLTSVGSQKKHESSRKTSTIDYAKAFGSVDCNELWKILQEMGTLGHLTWFLRKMYAGQEATVRTGHGTTDWFQIGERSTSRLYIVTLLV